MTNLKEETKKLNSEIICLKTQKINLCQKIETKVKFQIKLKIL